MSSKKELISFEMENKYLIAKDCTQAIAFANANEGFSYIAGGTDVMINKYQKNNISNTLIDLTHIEALNSLEINNEEVIIGSATTLASIESNTTLNLLFPTFIDAVKSVASPLVRNSATLGGNILCDNRCIFYNQSEWWRTSIGNCLKCDGDICIAAGGKKKCFAKMVSDTAPVLISLQALVEIVDENGTQIVPLESIYSGDGIEPHLLSKLGIIKNIIIPVLKLKCSFHKLRERKTLDFTSLTVAVSVSETNIRVALGGIDPKPVVFDFDINMSREEIINKVTKKSRTVKNDLYSRKYRKDMIEIYINKSLNEIM